MSRYEDVSGILGRDFISPEHVVLQRKGIVYSRERLHEMRQKLPNEKVLHRCAEEGLVLLPGPPHEMSLCAVRVTNKSLFFHGRGWYLKMNEPFAYLEKVSSPWFAVRKKHPPEWLRKKFVEQRRLLSDSESVMNGAETAWVLTTYRIVVGTPLYPLIALRTSSIARNCNRVCAGFDGPDGINIWNLDDYQEEPNISIAATLMF